MNKKTLIIFGLIQFYLSESAESPYSSKTPSPLKLQIIRRWTQGSYEQVLANMEDILAGKIPSALAHDTDLLPEFALGLILNNNVLSRSQRVELLYILWRRLEEDALKAFPKFVNTQRARKIIECLHQGIMRNFTFHSLTQTITHLDDILDNQTTTLTQIAIATKNYYALQFLLEHGVNYHYYMGQALATNDPIIMEIFKEALAKLPNPFGPSAPSSFTGPIAFIRTPEKSISSTKKKPLRFAHHQCNRCKRYHKHA